MPISFRDVNLLVFGIFIAFWVQFFYDYADAAPGAVPSMMEGAEVTMLLFAGAWLVVNVVVLFLGSKSAVPE